MKYLITLFLLTFLNLGKSQDCYPLEPLEEVFYELYDTNHFCFRHYDDGNNGFILAIGCERTYLLQTKPIRWVLDPRDERINPCDFYEEGIYLYYDFGEFSLKVGMEVDH